MSVNGMEALFEIIHWLRIAINPRCSKHSEYSRQCERTDTKVIQFSDKYCDFVRACPEHEPYYRRADDHHPEIQPLPLARIRTGR